MTTVLDCIGAHVAEQGLHVRKAIPRGPDHLLLVLGDRHGGRVAGQWFRDAENAPRVARETREATRARVDVRVLGDSGVMLQPDGADRRLRRLHALATAPGSRLVAHRAERRALVRHVGQTGVTTYTKVVRPERFTAMLAGMHVTVGGVAVPTVIAADPTAGTMTCTALAGRTLQQLLEDPTISGAALQDLGRAVGAAVARLHAAAPRPGAGRHDAAAELAVTRGWLERAHAYGLLDTASSVIREAEQAAVRLLAGPPCEATYLHRDLHDMQVLVDGSGAVGILDFDLATTGEPALDLANLLVHLELKAALGACAAERAADCAEAVVAGYAPSREVWGRMPGYSLTARLRLAAVYAFRPAYAQVGAALLSDPTDRHRGLLEERKARR